MEVHTSSKGRKKKAKLLPRSHFGSDKEYQAHRRKLGSDFGSDKEYQAFRRKLLPRSHFGSDKEYQAYRRNELVKWKRQHGTPAQKEKLQQRRAGQRKRYKKNKAKREYEERQSSNAEDSERQMGGTSSREAAEILASPGQLDGGPTNAVAAPAKAMGRAQASNRDESNLPKAHIKTTQAVFVVQPSRTKQPAGNPLRTELEREKQNIEDLEIQIELKKLDMRKQQLQKELKKFSKSPISEDDDTEENTPADAGLSAYQEQDKVGDNNKVTNSTFTSTKADSGSPNADNIPRKKVSFSVDCETAQAVAQPDALEDTNTHAVAQPDALEDTTDKTVEDDTNLSRHNSVDQSSESFGTHSASDILPTTVSETDTASDALVSKDAGSKKKVVANQTSALDDSIGTNTQPVPKDTTNQTKVSDTAGVLTEQDKEEAHGLASSCGDATQHQLSNDVVDNVNALTLDNRTPKTADKVSFQEIQEDPSKLTHDARDTEQEQESKENQAASQVVKTKNMRQQSTVASREIFEKAVDPIKLGVPKHDTARFKYSIVISVQNGLTPADQEKFTDMLQMSFEIKGKQEKEEFDRLYRHEETLIFSLKLKKVNLRNTDNFSDELIAGAIVPPAEKQFKLTICDLPYIFVVERYRNHNVGSCLLENIEEHLLHANGVDMIKLQMVDDEQVRRFYERAGYKGWTSTMSTWTGDRCQTHEQENALRVKGLSEMGKEKLENAATLAENAALRKQLDMLAKQREREEKQHEREKSRITRAISGCAKSAQIKDSRVKNELQTLVANIKGSPPKSSTKRRGHGNKSAPEAGSKTSKSSKSSTLNVHQSRGINGQSYNQTDRSTNEPSHNGMDGKEKSGPQKRKRSESQPPNSKTRRHCLDAAATTPDASPAIPKCPKDVLVLGMSTPSMEHTLMASERSNNEEYNATNGYKAAAAALRDKLLEEIDARDFARILELEKQRRDGDCRVFSVSREKAGYYNMHRHVNADFNKGYDFLRKLWYCFAEDENGERQLKDPNGDSRGRHPKLDEYSISMDIPDEINQSKYKLQFVSIVLDHMWAQKGWTRLRWLERFFNETLPFFAKFDLLKVKEGKIFIPFQYHCFYHIVKAQDRLFDFYHIRFVRMSGMKKLDPLWHATEEIPSEVLQNQFKKSKDQSEYTTMKKAEINQNTIESDELKKKLLEQYESLREPAEIYQIVLERLASNEKKGRFKQDKVMTENEKRDWDARQRGIPGTKQAREAARRRCKLLNTTADNV